MGDIFQRMIKSTSLLCSEIYEIQETWTGQCKLQYHQLCSKDPAQRVEILPPHVPLRVP